MSIYSTPWDVNRPAGGTQAKLIDDEIRQLRHDLEERLEDTLFVDMAADPIVLKDSVLGKKDGITRIIGFPEFIASTQGKEIDYFREGYGIGFTDSGALVASLLSVVPVGCVVTKLEWLVDKAGTDGLVCEFSRRPFVTGAFATGNFVVINTVNVNAGGWAIYPSVDLNIPIVDDEIYYLAIEANGAAGISYRFGGCRITFNRDSTEHAN